MSVNKIIILGNCGKDPEIRNTKDGKEIANFSIATSESWKDKSTGEKKEKTEWHKVSVFSPGLVGIVKSYVKKGSKLYIEGSLQTNKWEKDGKPQYTTEIVVKGFNSTIQLLDSKSDKVSQHSQDKGNGYVADVEDDFIPF